MSTASGDSGSMSDVSSIADDPAGMQDLQDSRDEDGLASDLVDESKTHEDTMFAIMYMLSSNRNGKDLRWTLGRMALDFLQGYDTFIIVFYILAATIVLTTVLTTWVALVLRKNEATNAWMRRLQAVLQFLSLIVYSIFWVATLDYMAFFFNCKWSQAGKGVAPHFYFTDIDCLDMPHVAHMVCALVIMVLFCCTLIMMNLSDCTLNPLTRNHLASSLPQTALKAIMLRIAIVLISTCLSELGNVQSVLMLISAVYITYCLLITVPYYHDLVNYIYVGLWSGITFTCVLLVSLDLTQNNFSDDQQGRLLKYRETMTNTVLYAIAGPVICGALVSFWYLRRRRQPLKQLQEAYEQQNPDVILKDVYRFKDDYEAEFLLRVMRKWDIDGNPDPDTTAFAEFILKCAMARLPNHPYLMTLYSYFIVEVRHDSSAARTQLQLAAKSGPTLLDRYFIYIGQEVIRNIKSDNDGMDLIGYVEFQRAYRACVKAHRLALQAQRQFWHSMLRDTVAYKDLHSSLELMDTCATKAAAMYKKVMEKYPANGRLLKVYGRFLEFVKNDPWGASKFYAEATKLGTEESLMSLTLQTSTDSTGVDAATRINAAMGAVDEKTDAIVIINASGVILMINGGGCKMLGYDKGELEGKNVSCLMPMPFSTRHNSWLQRHATTGKNHILNSMRQVVALHKSGSILPVSLTVTRISGIGLDSIYMGILRAYNIKDDGNVKVWALPNGVAMCCDDHFRDCFGITSSSVLGRNISSFSTDQEAFDRWIAACSELPQEAVINGQHKFNTRIVHKYLPPVDVEVTCEFGGSDQVRLLMITMRCLTDTLAMMVTDPRGRIEFTTTQLAKMIGYNVKAMTEGMNMAGLLPPPYSQLHPSYMKELTSKPPPSSCRAGAVVHLCHANTTRVPVTLQLSQRDNGERTQHVIKVIPATIGQLLDQQRVELRLNHKGVVVSVNENASKMVFGFAPSALVGRPLTTFVNMFSEWRQKFGDAESLLVMLGKRAEQKQDVVIRVGIHNPMTDNEILQLAEGTRVSVDETKGSESIGSTLLSTLQQRRKERSAVMTLRMIQLSDEEEARAATLEGSESTAVLAVDLWRAEGLTSLVEVNDRLAITKAEQGVGLIFGMSTQVLMGSNFKDLAGLSPATTALDLLTGSGGKKSMLKKGAAWKMGPVMTLDANHTDKTPLKLQLQAVSKDGKSSDHLMITLRVLESSFGNLATLEVLKSSGLSSDAAMLSSGRAGGQQDSSDSASEIAAWEPAEEGAANQDEQGGRSTAKRVSVDLHDHIDSRLRVAQWVDNSIQENANRKELNSSQPRAHRNGTQHVLGHRDESEAAAAADKHGKHAEADQDPAATAYVALGRTHVKKGSAGAFINDATHGRSVHKGFDEDHDAASDADGAASVTSGSQSAGDGLDAASSLADSEVEDELVADWRRAKRLKKLSKMMTSSTANVASERFRKHTYLLALLIIGAHVMCFTILYTEVDVRYQTAFEVGDMATGIQQTQMAAIFVRLVQSCLHPDFTSLKICHPDMVDQYLIKLKQNYDQLLNIHQGLYLGYNQLKTFRDGRLL
eukprot:gene3511-3781_t